MTIYHRGIQLIKSVFTVNFCLCCRMNLIPVLADILSSTQREKVTRIILALFRVSTHHLCTECLNIILLCSVNEVLTLPCSDCLNIFLCCSVWVHSICALFRVHIHLIVPIFPCPEHAKEAGASLRDYEIKAGNRSHPGKLFYTLPPQNNLSMALLPPFPPPPPTFPFRKCWRSLVIQWNVNV